MPSWKEFFSRRWVRRTGIALGIVLAGVYLLFWILLYNPLEADLDREFHELAPEGTVVALHVRDGRGRWHAYEEWGQLTEYERSTSVAAFLE